jgi:hypothetical protein
LAWPRSIWPEEKIHAFHFTAALRPACVMTIGFALLLGGAYPR